ncbi:unnamed protein product [Amoebophrya sp. A25]|nr:unnamed protein product [Amoebophrya sp. A25]|eukprot:GSA25T00023527001.1
MSGATLQRSSHPSNFLPPGRQVSQTQQNGNYLQHDKEQTQKRQEQSFGQKPFVRPPTTPLVEVKSEPEEEDIEKHEDCPRSNATGCLPEQETALQPHGVETVAITSSSHAASATSPTGNSPTGVRGTPTVPPSGKPQTCTSSKSTRTRSPLILPKIPPSGGEQPGTSEVNHGAKQTGIEDDSRSSSKQTPTLPEASVVRQSSNAKTSGDDRNSPRIIDLIEPDTAEDTIKDSGDASKTPRKEDARTVSLGEAVAKQNAPEPSRDGDFGLSSASFEIEAGVSASSGSAPATSAINGLSGRASSFIAVAQDGGSRIFDNFDGPAKQQVDSQPGIFLDGVKIEQCNSDQAEEKMSAELDGNTSHDKQVLQPQKAKLVEEQVEKEEASTLGGSQLHPGAMSSPQVPAVEDTNKNGGPTAQEIEQVPGIDRGHSCSTENGYGDDGAPLNSLPEKTSVDASSGPSGERAPPAIINQLDESSQNEDCDAAAGSLKGCSSLPEQRDATGGAAPAGSGTHRYTVPVEECKNTGERDNCDHLPRDAGAHQQENVGKNVEGEDAPAVLPKEPEDPTQDKNSEMGPRCRVETLTASEREGATALDECPAIVGAASAVQHTLFSRPSELHLKNPQGHVAPMEGDERTVGVEQGTEGSQPQQHELTTFPPILQRPGLEPSASGSVAEAERQENLLNEAASGAPPEQDKAGRTRTDLEEPGEDDERPMQVIAEAPSSPGTVQTVQEDAAIGGQQAGQRNTSGAAMEQHVDEDFSRVSIPGFDGAGRAHSSAETGQPESEIGGAEGAVLVEAVDIEEQVEPKNVPSAEKYRERTENCEILFLKWLDNKLPLGKKQPKDLWTSASDPYGIDWLEVIDGKIRNCNSVWSRADASWWLQILNSGPREIYRFPRVDKKKWSVHLLMSLASTCSRGLDANYEYWRKGSPLRTQYMSLRYEAGGCNGIDDRPFFEEVWQFFHSKIDTRGRVGPDVPAYVVSRTRPSLDYLQRFFGKALPEWNPDEVARANAAAAAVDEKADQREAEEYRCRIAMVAEFLFQSETLVGGLEEGDGFPVKHGYCLPPAEEGETLHLGKREYGLDICSPEYWYKSLGDEHPDVMPRKNWHFHFRDTFRTMARSWPKVDANKRRGNDEQWTYANFRWIWMQHHGNRLKRILEIYPWKNALAETRPEQSRSPAVQQVLDAAFYLPRSTLESAEKWRQPLFLEPLRRHMLGYAPLVQARRTDEPEPYQPDVGPSGSTRQDLSLLLEYQHSGTDP